MPDLTTNIEENAQQPKKASGDAGSVETHSLREQIEADRYLKGNEAMKGRTLGIKRSRIVPPGAQA